MRAISLWQPWASFVARKFKQIETRSWFTLYRGELLIHAAKRKVNPADWDLQAAEADGQEFPLGVVVAIATLDSIELADTLKRDKKLSEQEMRLGDYTDGRYGWILTNIRPLYTPIRAKGAQGLWTPSPELVARCLKAVA